MADAPKIIVPEKMNTPAEEAAKANLRQHAQEARDGLAKIDSAKAAQEEAARVARASQTAEAADRAANGVAQRAAAERAAAEQAKPTGLIERARSALGMKKPEITTEAANARLAAAAEEGKAAVEAAKNTKGIQIANGVAEGPKHSREFLEQASKQARAELDAMKAAKPAGTPSASATSAAEAADKATARIAAKAAAERAAEETAKSAAGGLKGAAAGVARWLGPVGAVATTWFGAHEIKERLENDDSHGAAKAAGKTLGGIAGVAGGAALGQVIIPIPVVGAVVGGVACYFGLSALGGAAGGALVSGEDDAMRKAAIEKALSPTILAPAAGASAPAAGASAPAAPAPAAPASPAPVATDGVIVVKDGDSLSKIAIKDPQMKAVREAVEKAFNGHADKLTVTLITAMAMAEANDIQKPDHIEAGWKIDVAKTMAKLPEVVAKMRTHPAMLDDKTPGQITLEEFKGLQAGVPNLQGKTRQEILGAR